MAAIGVAGCTLLLSSLPSDDTLDSLFISLGVSLGPPNYPPSHNGQNVVRPGHNLLRTDAIHFPSDHQVGHFICLADPRNSLGVPQLPQNLVIVRLINRVLSVVRRSKYCLLDSWQLTRGVKGSNPVIGPDDLQEFINRKVTDGYSWRVWSVPLIL